MWRYECRDAPRSTSARALAIQTLILFGRVDVRQDTGVRHRYQESPPQFVVDHGPRPTPEGRVAQAGEERPAEDGRMAAGSVVGGHHEARPSTVEGRDEVRHRFGPDQRVVDREEGHPVDSAVQGRERQPERGDGTFAGL